MTNNTNTLCDLSHLGLLEISGADASSFLQGQVTNDVKLLMMTNQAHFSGYCNPKGRLLALFLAFYHDDHFYLQFDRALIEPIAKRLKMYVMRSKVEINDVSESIVKWGIDGPEAADILATVFAKVPTQTYEFASLENGVILKLASANNHARFEVLCKAAHASNIWDTLKNHCQIVEKPYWDWLDIQAGIPEIVAATQEQFVPQMLNLDILNGINFKKGCYTGQEIVARTHYLGSVKRRTYLAEINVEAAPQAGDKILDGAQNEVGQVVRVAANMAHGFDALVEMRIDAALSGEVFCKGAAITIKPLPYSLEDQI